MLLAVYLYCCFRSGEILVFGQSVVSDVHPIPWFLSLFFVVLVDLVLFTVALGGMICIYRDINEKRGS